MMFALLTSLLALCLAASVSYSKETIDLVAFERPQGASYTYGVNQIAFSDLDGDGRDELVAMEMTDIRDGPRVPFNYERHRPEDTLLYQIIEEHWPLFQQQLAQQGKHLPAYVVKEFEAFLQCGCLEHGFLRVQCEACHAEKLLAFSCKRRGFCPSCGARRMVGDAQSIVPHTSAAPSG